MSTLKIYFENKSFYLTDYLSDELKNLVNQQETVFSEENSFLSVENLISQINTPSVNNVVLLSEDFKVLKMHFFHYFKLQKAGGGLVENEQSQILMIYRRGMWDLPKGKLEIGENMEECAIREVQEETGIQHISIRKKIGITYHTYTEHGRDILKESHWYDMTTNGDEILKPQIEEQITDIKWVSKNEIDKYLSETFAAIKDVIEISDWIKK